MPRVSGHRMRFYRRNFKRMYPDVVRRMERRQRLQLVLRAGLTVAAAAAAVVAATAAWLWAIR